MNKKLLLISLSLIFLLSASSIIFAQQTASDIPAGTAEEYFNRGNFFRKQGNLTQAVSDYTNAIRVNSRHAKAYYNRGNVYVKQGDLAQAIADYTKAVEINPDYSEAYYNRANTYEKQGNVAQAISDYTKAIKINPKYAAAYCNRGNVYQSQGNLQQAINDYNKALGENPNDNASLYNRGLAYYGIEQYGKSLEDYTVAISQNPSKEAYENFIKNVPEKKASDIKNTRNEILQAFEDKINPEKKMAPPAAVAMAEAPSTTTPVAVALAAPENQAQAGDTQTETKSIPEEDVRNLVIKWVASWESGDIKTYRGCYASDFQSKGMNLSEWVTYKNNIRQKSKNISIKIDDLQISVDENNAMARFTQTYSSSILKDKGTKTLELKKIKNEWKIYREIM